MKIKYSLSIILICFFIFILFNFFDKNNRENINILNKESAIDILILKSSVYKTTLTLNDSVAIYYKSPLIKTKNSNLNYIKEIKPPYKLLKNKGTNFFSVIKDNHTLYFQIIEF